MYYQYRHSMYSFIITFIHFALYNNEKLLYYYPKSSSSTSICIVLLTSTSSLKQKWYDWLKILIDVLIWSIVSNLINIFKFERLLRYYIHINIHYIHDKPHHFEYDIYNYITGNLKVITGLDKEHLYCFIQCINLDIKQTG